MLRRFRGFRFGCSSGLLGLLFLWFFIFSPWKMINLEKIGTNTPPILHSTFIAAKTATPPKGFPNRSVVASQPQGCKDLLSTPTPDPYGGIVYYWDCVPTNQLWELTSTEYKRIPWHINHWEIGNYIVHIVPVSYSITFSKK